MVMITKHSTNFIGYQISIGLKIGQDSRDIELKHKIKEYFNCGKVYHRNKDSRIVIKKFLDIKEIVIPHYITFSLENRKAKEFRIWKEIANLIENKKH
jgi:exopolysaccharide biosynthesis predicted pyruvyltransferase EpsI